MSGKIVNLLSSLATLALVAGCTSTNMTDAFSFSKKKDDTTNTAADTSNKPIVVQGSCPLVYLREGTAVYTQYANAPKKKKKAELDVPTDQDPDKLIMQATLDQTTRQCFQNASGLKITVVVHGRLVLGPAGKPGSTFSLPIRVAATDGDRALYSELSQFQVTLPAGQTSTQFIFTKENVMLNETDQGGLTRLFAGIDEGPYNTK